MIGIALAVVFSFVGSSNTTKASGVVKLDSTATTQFNGVKNGSDPTGQKIGDLSYLKFNGETTPLKTGDTPLLINIWSSTCIPCITEMPALEKAWQANRDKIDVIGLNYFETPDLGQAMANRTGVTYPLGRDNKGTILRTLGGVGLPYTVLIGSNGTILAVHAGALDEAGFQALIDMAVSKK